MIDSETLGTIFFAVWLFFALIFALNGLLTVRKFKWQFAVSKIAVVVLSAVAAVVVSKWIAKLFGSGAYSAIEMLIEGEADGKADIEALEVFANTVKTVMATVIAPLIFVTVFLIIKSILGAINRGIMKSVLKAGSNESGNMLVPDSRIASKKSALSLLFGAISGFFVFIVLITPTVGFFRTFGGVINNTVLLVDNDVESDLEPVYSVFDALSNNSGAKCTGILGGDIIYNELTSCKINGTTVSMRNEAQFAESLLKEIPELKDEAVEPQRKTEIMEDLLKDFDKTAFIPMLAADFVSEASERWLNGESFFGVDAPLTEENTKELMYSVFEVMSDSTFETIKKDINTFCNIAFQIIDSRVFDETETADAIRALAENKDIMSNIIFELLDNERLLLLIDDVSNTGINMVASAMDIPLNRTALYDRFIESMKEDVREYIIYGSAHSLEQLAEAVLDNYESSGLSLPDGAEYCIAISLIKYCNGNELSAEELAVFFAGESGENVRSSYKRIKGKTNEDTSVEMLTELVKEELAGCGISEEEVDTVAMKIADKLADGKNAYVADGDMSFANAQELSEKSVLVTADMMKTHSDKVSNKRAEAERFAEMIAVASEFMKDIENIDDDTDIGNLMKNIGTMLDITSESEIIGDDVTQNILMGMLQCKPIRKTLGLSISKATDIATKIIEGATNGDSYAIQLESIGNTADVVKNANKGDAKDAVEALITSITPASSETLKEIVSTNVLENMGVSEQSKDILSDVMNDVLDGMVSFKENADSEEFKSEAEAIDKVLSLMLKESDDISGGIFDKEAYEASAEEYIKGIANSKIITDVIVDTVYKNGEFELNPFGLDADLPQHEKEAVVNVLDGMLKEHNASSSDDEANKDYVDLMVSIASIMNVEVNVNGNDITLA